MNRPTVRRPTGTTVTTRTTTMGEYDRTEA